jgi:hypothetical protein
MTYYLPIYVPRPGHPELAHIDPGSAIVGVPLDDGRVAIYYEGNRYGSASMERLADRMAQAAARLRFDYPTVAKARVPSESLVQVGRYDGVEGRVEVSDRDAERELCRWLGVDQLDPTELKRSEVGPPAA